MLYRKAALAKAAAEVGVREVGGNNRGSRVAYYQSFDSYAPVPDTGYAWCDSFVDACFAMAGRPLSELARSAGVSLTLQLAKQHGWVVPLYEATAGDVVVFTFDHIGFVEKVHRDKTGRVTALQTIEGNTGSAGAVSDSAFGGDGVYRKVRDASLVLSLVRVPGEAPEPVLPAWAQRAKGLTPMWAWFLWKDHGAPRKLRPAHIPRRVPLVWFPRYARHKGK